MPSTGAAASLAALETQEFMTTTPTTPIPSIPPKTRRWDIFCRVIDNYGDAGVCWRLARQLSEEFGQAVRLWIDDAQALLPLLGLPADGMASGQVGGVNICSWTPALQDAHSFPVDEVADLVIEAFACDLPPAYLAAMARRTPAPIWVDLEYLSAEAWVEDCHGLCSRHPQLGLTRTMFFPGFAARTGGLIRESWLPLPTAPSPERQPASLAIFLFSYACPALPALLDAWQRSPFPIELTLPPGAAAREARHYLQALPSAHRELAAESRLRSGSLDCRLLPAFVPQREFDTLLRRHDLVFVRGEDSFVRAQLAARPLVWQIYPQAEDAHTVKLQAFLDRYAEPAEPIPQGGKGEPFPLDVDALGSLARFNWAWNHQDAEALVTAWAALSHQWPAPSAALSRLQGHAQAWARRLFAQPSLATHLMQLQPPPTPNP